MTSCKKIKLAIVSVPFSGHLYPLISLLLPLLDDERFDIRILTGVQKVPLLNSLGFDAVGILKDQPTAMEEIANSQSKLNIFGMYKQLNRNIELFPIIMDELEQAFTDRQPDIVVADFVAVPAGIVCRKLGIPWMTTIPTPFAIESLSQTPSYLGGWLPPKNRVEEVRDWFGRKIIRLFKRTLFFMVKGKLTDVNLQLYNEKGEETIYSPESILALGMRELEFRTDFPEHLCWVGPCVSSFQQTTLPIRSERSTVLITTGTHLYWSKEKMILWVSELARTYQEFDFLITLGDGQSIKVEKVANNVTVYGYLAYESILPMVDFVVHHGGAGILYACIQEGIPALILPHDYDQFDYAVRAQLKGIGLVSMGKRKKEFFKKFQLLVEQSEWPELEYLSRQLMTYQPTNRLVEEVLRILGVKECESL